MKHNGWVYLGSGLLISGLVLFFLFFNSKPTEAAANTNEPRLLLDDRTLYNSDSVKEAVDALTNINKETGMKIFLKAVDTYKNKHNPGGAIGLFKKSLYYFPQAKGFFELGNALKDSRKTEEARDAYGIASDLEYDPISSVRYGVACTYALENEADAAFESLEYACQEGFVNRSQLMGDAEWNTLKNTARFKQILLNYFKEENERLAMLGMFLKSFDSTQSLPYSIQDAAAAYDAEREVSYDFADFVPDMENGRFSRDVTNGYSHLALLLRTDSFTVVSYASMEYLADTLNPVSVFLATYDNATGKLVDNLELACRCSAKEIKTGSMDENRNIEIKTVKQVWKFDPFKNGYEGNTILRTEDAGTAWYWIDDSGHFYRKSSADEVPPIRDSAVIVQEESDLSF